MATSELESLRSGSCDDGDDDGAAFNGSVDGPDLALEHVFDSFRDLQGALAALARMESPGNAGDDSRRSSSGAGGGSRGRLFESFC